MLSDQKHNSSIIESSWLNENSSFEPGSLAGKGKAAVVVCLVATLGWIILSITNLISGAFILSIIEGCMAILTIIITWLLVKKAVSISKLTHLMLALVAIAFSYMFITGGVEGSGAYGIFIFPIAALFFAGLHIGALWAAVFFIVNSLALITVIYSDNILPYTEFELQRIGIVYIIIGLLSYFFEALHNRHEFQISFDNSKFKSLIENAPDIIATVDPIGRLNFISPSFERILGHSPNETIGKNAFEFIHPDNKKEVMAALTRVVLKPGSVEHVEFRFRKKDNTWIFLEAFGQAIIDDNGIVTVVVNARDLSERKKAERDLERINDCLLSFGTDPLENVNSLTGLCGELLKADCALFNCIDGEMLCSIGQWQSPPGYNPVDKPEGHICFDVIKQNNNEPFVVRDLQHTSYAKSDPNVAPYNLQTYIGIPVKMGDNNIGSLCVVYQDDHILTESEKKILGIVSAAIATEESRRESEEEMRESNQRLSEAQRIAHLGSWEWDIETGDLIWTDEAFHIFGLKPSSNSQSYKKFIGYVHPDDRKMVQESIRKTLEENAPYNINHRIILGDGTEREVNEEGKVIFNDEGKPVRMIGTIHDVTEKKLLEEQFLQSQKMESIGTLVGGIAHDFNNTLAAMKGNTYLARRHVESNSLALAKLDNIERLSSHAAEVVQQLLTFARKDRIETSLFSLNSLLEESFKLSKTTIPENINHVYDLCSDELFIEGSVSLMQQLLMNLLSNAIDAVADTPKPEITCGLRPLEVDDRFLKKHPKLEKGNYACLTVRDNGTGIKQQDIENIFDPFFTTKEIGKGSGLGLSMVYGTVNRHNGIIEIESNVGKGTAFHIYLPRKIENIETPDVEAHPVISQEGYGETILLIDDDQDIRDTTCEVLESMGYQVLIASDGVDGLGLFDANQKNIDAVISDVVMPNMSGAELAKRIHKEKENLPIILATGYDKGLALSTNDKHPYTAMVHKPFSYEELNQILRRFLDPEDLAQTLIKPIKSKKK